MAVATGSMIGLGILFFLDFFRRHPPLPCLQHLSLMVDLAQCKFGQLNGFGARSCDRNHFGSKVVACPLGI